MEEKETKLTLKNAKYCIRKHPLFNNSLCTPTVKTVQIAQNHI